MFTIHSHLWSFCLSFFAWQDVFFMMMSCGQWMCACNGRVVCFRDFYHFNCDVILYFISKLTVNMGCISQLTYTEIWFHFLIRIIIITASPSVIWIDFASVHVAVLPEFGWVSACVFESLILFGLVFLFESMGFHLPHFGRSWPCFEFDVSKSHIHSHFTLICTQYVSFTFCLCLPPMV